MNKKTFLFAPLLLLLLVGISNAQSLIVSQATPVSAFQFLNNTYSVTINDTFPNATLSNITWYFNGSIVGFQNFSNVSNTIATVQFPYNYTGNYTLRAVVYDSLNNTNSSNTTIDIIPYLLPSISTITPTNTTVNVTTIFGVAITQGSFSVANLTWGFPNNYLTDVAIQGNNYQQYTFTAPGYYSVTAQVCDINDFCSQSTTTIYVASNLPSSYWQVSNAVLYLNDNFPNPEKMTLTFIPYNDTNPLSQVSINWGDGSQITVYNYNPPLLTGATQTYNHYYQTLGSYNISVTTCDTIGNCYTTPIATVNVTQNIVGNIGQVLINNGGVTTPGLLQSIYTYFTNNFGGAIIGTIIFAIVMLIVAIILGALIFFTLLFLIQELIHRGFEGRRGGRLR